MATDHTRRGRHTLATHLPPFMHAHSTFPQRASAAGSLPPCAFGPCWPGTMAIEVTLLCTHRPPGQSQSELPTQHGSTPFTGSQQGARGAVTAAHLMGISALPAHPPVLLTGCTPRKGSACLRLRPLIPCMQPYPNTVCLWQPPQSARQRSTHNCVPLQALHWKQPALSSCHTLAHPRNPR